MTAHDSGGAKPSSSLLPADATPTSTGDETPPLHSSPAYQVSHLWIRLAFGAVGTILAPHLKVSGRYHVPRRGGVLLTPNHISDIDWPYLFAVTPRPLWFMAKSELFEMGVLGPIIRFCQAFPVERDSADRAALRYAEQLLQAGQALVIFPEGRCSPTGEMGPILPGAIMIALRAGVPIVPVGISGTNKVLPHSKLCPRPTLAPVHIHFGAPISLNSVSDLPRKEQREAATKRLEDSLQAARDVALKT